MRYLFLLISWFSCFALSGQNDSLVFEKDFEIESKHFGDTRTITVYLPPSYYEYPDDKFTVTYVLDGHFDPLIDLVAKTLEYNTYMNLYTPTIVVGVHAKERGWEFSPRTNDDGDSEYEGGRAQELQKHLSEEIIPLVDSMYGDRLRDFKSIMGHSSGGEFVLYSLFSKPDIFDGYIAISPGIREDSENIFDTMVNKLSDEVAMNKFFYASSGTVGEREEIFGKAVKKIDSILSKYPHHNIIWKHDHFEGMDHWTCVPPSINKSMVELTRAFRVDEKMLMDFSSDDIPGVKNQIISFYKKRNEQYGFSEPLLAGHVAVFSDHVFNKGYKKEAIECAYGLSKKILCTIDSIEQPLDF